VRLKWPVLGVALAIAVTTAMDTRGLAAFSALPLCPLMGILWYVERLSRPSVGLTWGRWRHYGLAALYPALVMGVLALISAATGAVNVSGTNWRKAGLNLLLLAASTFLVAILTEEGFFRGWLWASLERAGENESRVLVWTSAAFSLWHVSAVALKTGFDLPASRIPLFLLNVAVVGAIWGLLRWISGSILVTSLSHGVWNGMAYVLFGYGTKVGALGIKNTALYGPEVGVLGLTLNLLFLAGLWWWSRGSRTRRMI
jgi:CAAX protease family protein